MSDCERKLPEPPAPISSGGTEAHSPARRLAAEHPNALRLRFLMVTVTDRLEFWLPTGGLVA